MSSGPATVTPTELPAAAATTASTAAAEGGSLRRWPAALACAALLAGMAATMLAVIARKSITIDEIVMIPAGYYHVHGNFELVRDHPPLSKILAGLPLLSLPLAKVPPGSLAEEPFGSAYQWAHYERFWRDNATRFDAISFRARLGAIVLTLALGGLVFLYGRRLFGDRAALLAVALLSLDPTVLAHGRVVQTDIPAAFGFLLVVVAAHAYLARPGLARAAGLGGAAATAMLAKFSMLLAGPLVVAVLGARAWRARLTGWRSPPAEPVIVAVTWLLAVNAAYAFRHRPLVPMDLTWIADSFPRHAAEVTTAIETLSRLLPTQLVLGVFWQAWHNGEGHPAALLGMHSQTGWWYYLPVAFALKSTLPSLLVVVLALGWATYRAWRRRERRFLFALVPFALYTAFVLPSHINIGVRYYLPAFPFLFLLGGALLDRWLRGPAVARLLAAGLLVWIGVEAVRAYPDHMPYMGPLASRHPNWHYLSDSNVEWGDDLRALAEYLHARGESRVRSATLGGYSTLAYLGIENVSLIGPDPPPPPPTRYVAIGASFLNGSTVPHGKIGGRELTEEQRINLFDAYRRRRPEAVIGGSIYVFRDGE